MEVKGINIEGTEYKMTQYADDTTFIFDGTSKSLKKDINNIR